MVIFDYLLLILILEIEDFTVGDLKEGFEQSLPKNSFTEVIKVEKKLPAECAIVVGKLPFKSFEFERNMTSNIIRIK